VSRWRRPARRRCRPAPRAAPRAGAAAAPRRASSGRRGSRARSRSRREDDARLRLRLAAAADGAAARRRRRPDPDVAPAVRRAAAGQAGEVALDERADESGSKLPTKKKVKPEASRSARGRTRMERCRSIFSNISLDGGRARGWPCASSSCSVSCSTASGLAPRWRSSADRARLVGEERRRVDARRGEAQVHDLEERLQVVGRGGAGEALRELVDEGARAGDLAAQPLDQLVSVRSPSPPICATPAAVSAGTKSESGASEVPPGAVARRRGSRRP
jgi:hypothetical protein